MCMCFFSLSLFSCFSLFFFVVIVHSTSIMNVRVFFFTVLYFSLSLFFFSFLYLKDTRRFVCPLSVPPKGEKRAPML